MELIAIITYVFAESIMIAILGESLYRSYKKNPEISSKPDFNRFTCYGFVGIFLIPIFSIIYYIIHLIFNR